MENKATRPTKVPRKTKKVTPPLSKEDKELFNDKPTNRYAPKQRLGKPTIGEEKITTVGLGGLKVTTNGRTNN